MKKRLTINSDLQIFFDDNDKARFRSAIDAPLEAAKAELIEWQAFVETWLGEVEEEAKPKRLNLAQQELKKLFTPLTKMLRNRFKMTSIQIRDSLTSLIAENATMHPELSAAQVQAVIDFLVGGADNPKAPATVP